MIKAVCFSGVEQVSYRELGNLQIVSDDDAIVRVTTAGLCGSDLHPYFGRELGIDQGTILGHEFVGEVVATGANVQSLNNGDRVACPFTTNCGTCRMCQLGLTARCEEGQLFGWREKGKGLHGGQATHVRVPLADSTLMKLSHETSDEIAILMGDNLCTAYFATQLADLNQKDAIAVVGCGTVGLLAIQWARSLGVERVLAIEPNSHRRQMAGQLGAITASDLQQFKSLTEEATEGYGVDSVMEFVGLPDAQRTAFEVVRPGGTLASIGCHCTPHLSFSPSEAYDKNLTYRTGRCSASHYMETVQQMSASSNMDLSWCITHQFSLDQASEAYATFANRTDHCIKAVFKID